MKQHHIPQFLLLPWCGSDGRLCLIRNIRGRIQRTRRPPAKTGFEHDLYSYSQSVEGVERFEVETQFFSPLDNDAAVVVRKLIANHPIDDHDRTKFARFIAAMKIRTPENVELIRSIAERHVSRAVVNTGNPQWRVLLSADGFGRTIGLREIPELACGSEVSRDLRRMSWYCVDFAASRVPLLISDRPCVYTAGLHDRENCVIALPLSPGHAFYAFYPESAAQRWLMRQPITALARATNESVVRQAKIRAYCRTGSDAPDRFFRKRLRDSHGEGPPAAAWQPAGEDRVVEETGRPEA
jgi:hypothetical protein